MPGGVMANCVASWPAWRNGNGVASAAVKLRRLNVTSSGLAAMAAYRQRGGNASAAVSVRRIAISVMANINGVTANQ